MEKYDFKKIEQKWQRVWEKKKIFKAKNPSAGGSKKPKYYVLVEFPYPSGQGLHVGHCRSYIGLDIIARKKRMENYNVLFPMGWDAFGLPAENYAVKTGVHPAKATQKNTENFKSQQKQIGLSFDWSREINTTDLSYYKWTQWIFLQLFKKGLAYKAKIPINWCTSCKIGLANEEVVDGKCERCGGRVIQKEKEQWMLRITNYAERLIDDLDLVDYPERVKILQKEWIGKSEGAEITFKIHQLSRKVSVFTTKPDTLFGCTYLVLAPKHPLIEELKDKILNYSQVEKYIRKSKNRTEKDRLTEEKDKTGIELKGIKATNPVNNRKIPIFVADYVMMQYGTGAVMAVPVHDQRDFDFAKKYNLPMIEVIHPFGKENNRPRIDFSGGSFKKAYTGEGILINSGRFTGMKSREGRQRIVEWLFRKKLGKNKISYKLRDWVFSRQRYWGEPIPMVYCEKCKWQPVAEKDLPVKLPDIKNYQPTEEGDSPLAKVKNWVNVKCPKCQGTAKRETDVMPNWAGSNWYYLRYVDSDNSKKLADSKKLKYWMPVDWYNGGMEHTTLHLLYSRFIYKFLWDEKIIPKEIGPEPYKKRTSHGMVLGKGGIKMSKSKGNVINPEKVIKEVGADVLRVYEMFMGPFEQAIPWDDKGVRGVKRFLEKVWKLQEKVNCGLRTESYELKDLLNTTIKKVSEDIENLKFNTAVSSLMILANKLGKEKEISKKHYSQFLILLCPFAPHIAEELWQKAGFKDLCCQQKWPRFKKSFSAPAKINLVVQVNGKVRDKISMKPGFLEKEAVKISKQSSKVLKYIKNKKIKKVIFVKDKLINFVVQ